MSFALSSEALAKALLQGTHASGAIVVFEGRVRNVNEGRAVRSLEYEAFDELALKEGSLIVEEAQRQFPIEAAACVHRTGHLQVGDLAIRVEVLSGHRKEAFQACQWIVDQVKLRVPIWKREHYADGPAEWIDPAKSAQKPLTEDRLYERQIRLKELGAAGQEKLRQASVLVIGAGGLGSAVLPYLAAAGIGRIDICDHDRVEVENLHRQVLYGIADVGRLKAEVAAERCRGQNPFIQVDALCRSFDETVDLRSYDLVLECTDSLAAKFAANASAVGAGKPLIVAGIYRFEGQLHVIQPGGPCLACLWNERPTDGCVATCAEVGVLGAVPGVIGAMQALEALKLLLGLTLTDPPLVLFDLLSLETTHVRLQKRSDCPVCGIGKEPPSIELIPARLQDYRIVDIREPWETEEEPLPWPQPELMPLSQWDGFSADDRPVLFVCRSGVRTANLVRYLRSEGLDNTFSLPGGISTFKRLASTTI